MNKVIAVARRNTIQRTLVLEAVNELQCHATAEEVYGAIIQKHPTISRATVYRILNQLSETGEIRRLEMPGGADRFDHIPHEHYHVKCTACGRVFDVDMEVVTGLEHRIRDPHGFDFTGYDILFHGVCPECKQQKDAAET
ncbi:MAG: Fur family transcriptional regulator [Aristaeellaceae bacterium]